MARGIPSALATEIDKPVVNPFLAVRIELPDPVYAFTGRGMLTFNDADGNSRDWIGAGDVGSIDTIGEGTDGSATGVKVALYDAPSDFRKDIADQATQGALFEIDVGALDGNFQTVVATQLIWKGRTSEYLITDAGAAITVEVSGESRAIDQRRPAIKRFTDEYQQRIHPGDLIFQYVSQMTSIAILWAQAELSAGAVMPVGGAGGIGGGPGGFIGTRLTSA